MTENLPVGNDILRPISSMSAADSKCITSDVVSLSKHSISVAAGFEFPSPTSVLNTSIGSSDSELLLISYSWGIPNGLKDPENLELGQVTRKNCKYALN